MNAALVKGLQEMTVTGVPTPQLDGYSALLKVESCAVCGSDLRILESGNDRVQYPAIIGHEMSGKIVEIADGVQRFKLGDRVAIGADVPCGECDTCRDGDGNMCDINFAMGYQFAGGFAEYCLLNETVLKHGPVTVIPDSLSYDEAALAEPLACCLNGLERIRFAKGQSVLIIGSGPIGILLALTAKAMGASKTLLADLSNDRLNQARGFNIDHLLHTADQSLIEQVLTILPQGVDSAFTACPSPAAQQEALPCLAKRGALNYFGGLAKGSDPILVDSNLVHYKELIITGSHGSTPKQHAAAIELIASGKIPAAELITHRFPLSKVQEAFDTVKEKKGLKVMVHPHE